MGNPDRSANGAAELVAFQYGPGIAQAVGVGRGGRIIEIEIGVQVVVAQIVVQASVEAVGAGFSHYADDAATRIAVLGLVVVREDAELGDCIGVGIQADAAIGHCVVGAAIEQEEDLVRASSS